jgi:hypothetical protein
MAPPFRFDGFETGLWILDLTPGANRLPPPGVGGAFRQGP